MLKPKFFQPETHNIPGRELSVEEQSQQITKDRFHEWMCKAGEDYVDQTSMFRDENLIFVGFLLHKYQSNPTVVDRLLQVGNERILDTLMIQHTVYEDAYGDDPVEFKGTLSDEAEAWEAFYTDLAEFINTTVNLKARTNANLILVCEHYKD
jgi:hypothetical protein